jgi:hypothetical protein
MVRLPLAITIGLAPFVLIAYLLGGNLNLLLFIAAVFIVAGTVWGLRMQRARRTTVARGTNVRRDRRDPPSCGESSGK